MAESSARGLRSRPLVMSCWSAEESIPECCCVQFDVVVDDGDRAMSLVRVNRRLIRDVGDMAKSNICATRGASSQNCSPANVARGRRALIMAARSQFWPMLS
jgi:hypothetical protein